MAVPAGIVTLKCPGYLLTPKRASTHPAFHSPNPQTRFSLAVPPPLLHTICILTPTLLSCHDIRHTLHAIRLRDVIVNPPVANFGLSLCRSFRTKVGGNGAGLPFSPRQGDAHTNPCGRVAQGRITKCTDSQPGGAVDASTYPEDRLLNAHE